MVKFGKNRSLDPEFSLLKCILKGRKKLTQARGACMPRGLNNHNWSKKILTKGRIAILSGLAAANGFVRPRPSSHNGPHESVCKLHMERFSHFCMVHERAQLGTERAQLRQKDKETDRHTHTHTHTPIDHEKSVTEQTHKIKKTSTFVFGDGPISTHAEPTSTRRASLA